MFAHPVSRIGVAGHDQSAVDGCDLRKPSTICSAVSIPQVPFATSKENVPWASSWGSSGLAPMSC